MYVCMYTYILMYVHVYIHVHTCTCTYMTAPRWGSLPSLLANEIGTHDPQLVTRAPNDQLLDKCKIN